MEEETAGGGTRDVAVVGGGVGGLTAAALLARAGLDVTLFETRDEVGGRARTTREEGFAFNEGPHALYREGALAGVASELDIELSGGAAPTWNVWGVVGGSLYRLPVSFRSLLWTSGLGWREKLALGRFMAGLERLEPAEHAGTPVGRWIDRRLEGGAPRAVLRALVRLTTYCPDDGMDAGAALEQLRKASRGTLYLDGGWQGLVDGLREAARGAGAVVETSSRVKAVHWDRDPLRVRVADGAAREARHAVLAVRPAEAARLAEPTPPSLEEAAGSARPLRVASLDLALSGLPVPERVVALGLDAPLYLSDHAEAADLAPGNAALVHSVVYLGGRTPRPDEDRARIEAFLDRVQPGWGDRVLGERFLPGAVVSHDTPLAETGGLAGRYGPGVEEADRLHVAGDWVGPTGMLSDAAAASARRAAAEVRRRHRGD